MIKVLQGEVDRSIEIFLEAARWGRRTGKALWSDEDLSREQLLKYYAPSEFYLIQKDGEDAGAMVIQWEDTLFWPGHPNMESGYLHKLCIKRKFSGIGFADQMIEVAEEICLKNGVDKLRLDTGWGNEALCALYEKNGFVLHDRFWLEEDCDFARYEKKLTSSL